MNRLYHRLAVNHIKNNKDFYLPYQAAGMVMAAFCYIIGALWHDPGLETVRYGAYLQTILKITVVIIAVFAAIILFYANYFVLRRRQKEIAVFNILGMEKRRIAKVLTLETLYIMCVSLIGGIAAGICLDKLMRMILYRLTEIYESVHFYISLDSILLTVILFAAIYLSSLLWSLVKVKLSKPVELLYGGQKGEREPKTNVPAALLGLGCVGAGYVLSLSFTTLKYLDNLALAAVLLVLAGTYFLFGAASIMLIKQLRKNKKYYYRPEHFTVVSDMLYRMKHNAAGLASICVLSTMVIVTVSSTAAFYAGMETVISARFPFDICITGEWFYYCPGAQEQQAVYETVTEYAQEMGLDMEGARAYAYLPLTMVRKTGDSFSLLSAELDNGYSYEQSLCVYVLTQDSFAGMTGMELPERLEEQEVYLIDGTAKAQPAHLRILGLDFDVAGNSGIEVPDWGIGVDCYLVIASDAVMNQLFVTQLGMQSRGQYYYNIEFNAGETKEDKLEAEELIKGVSQRLYDADFNLGTVYTSGRVSTGDLYRKVYGGVLFSGITLSALFLAAAVLLIFYKQLSEGYESRARFEIMQKVGMDEEMIRKSIRTQIRIVFFLPLVTAAVHVTVAYPLLKRSLLAIFNVHNMSDYYLYTMPASLLLFSVIYFLVYRITGNMYYRIVGGRK